MFTFTFRYWQSQCLPSKNFLKSAWFHESHILGFILASSRFTVPIVNHPIFSIASQYKVIVYIWVSLYIYIHIYFCTIPWNLSGVFPPTHNSYVLFDILNYIYFLKPDTSISSYCVPVLQSRKIGALFSPSPTHPHDISNVSWCSPTIIVTRRRMARERRGAGSSLFSMETQFYKQYMKDVL